MTEDPLPRMFGGETYREKATRKFKENPWVPIGAVATSAALITAMFKMRKGDSRSFNRWLRVRVVAQGLTVAAMVVGTYTIGTKNTDASKTQLEADAAKRNEERREREKDEFEERLRAAEEVHKAEMGIIGSTGRGAGSERVEAMAKVKGWDEAGEPSVGSRSQPKSKGGWLGWLGWRGSSPSGSGSSTDGKAGSTSTGSDSSKKP